MGELVRFEREGGIAAITLDSQHNRNALLWRDAAVDGIKTGHHSGAGFCLAASAKRDNERLITVVMGTKGEKVRADMTQELLNYGFRFYETHKLYSADKPVAEPTLWKGQADTIALGVSEDVLVTLPRGRYIYSRDTLGATEGGSSGSPVVNGGLQIVGQLYGVCGFDINNVCNSEDNSTVDGAFANAYAGMAPFLNPTGGGSCSPAGANCSSNSECCSNNCKGKTGAKTCK